MRVLLDECLPKRLGRYLEGHDVATVPQMGWSGIKNGKLLQLMARELFDVFVTIDGNLPYQQNLAELPVAIITLVAINNRLPTLLPLVPAILDALATCESGDVIWIET